MAEPFAGGGGGRRGYLQPGPLTLSNTTLIGNAASGSNGAGRRANGQTAAGGGLFSTGGTLTLSNRTLFEQDYAIGGNGGDNGGGGDALGGGLCTAPQK